MSYYRKEETKYAKLLLQSLPDSHDQLIMNLTNNILIEYLVFNDVATFVLEEKNRRKNKEDRQASFQQAKVLTMMKGRLIEHRPSGSYSHDKSK